MNNKYYDLTTAITLETIVFPGDPSFSVKSVTSIEEGSCFNLCQMSLSNHLGTHIDFPAHVIKNGKTSSDYALDYLVNDGQIIEVPEDQPTITPAFIEQAEIFENAIVFFKTKNSSLSKSGAFTKDYVYIEPNAAEVLLKKKVKIVGIDYLSVDSYAATELPVHHVLLSREVLIVENLALHSIEPGQYKIFIMPLNIPGMDGLPVRVIAIQ